MIIVRCRCSTTAVTVAISTATIRIVPMRSFVRSETKTGRAMEERLAGSLEPHLPERDVRIAETVDLHALHVRLEQTLVRVVPDWNHRRILHDQLLRATVELDATRHVQLGPRLIEKPVHRRIGVAHMVERT